VFHSVFRKIDPLLEKIPPAELELILKKVEDLAAAIEGDPALYEPVHCEHGHGVKRREGRLSEVSHSRAVVRRLFERGELITKIAYAATASYFVWAVAEYQFWWF